MIVFDLSCDEGHRFEGWFGSSADFEEQRRRGLLECPVCASKAIAKAPMAPAVPAKSNRAEARGERKPGKALKAEENAAMAPGSAFPPELREQMREALTSLAKVQRKTLSKSEWVGDKFAETSRRIHYGEAEDKPIHGRASAKEAEALHEEGIAILPIIVPFAPPDEIN